jgi:peroxiredoxin
MRLTSPTFAICLIICVAARCLACAEGFEQLDSAALRDQYGQSRSFAEFGKQPVLVIAFLGTECPLARLYASRLAKLSHEFSDRGVQFVGISSNLQDSSTELVHFARQHGIEFPLWKDFDQGLANLFEVSRIPEAIVLDRAREIRYRGRIDDQYSIGRQRARAEREDLRIALEELLAGQSISIPRTEPPGCLIGRPAPPDSNAKITWHDQISRLMQTHCQECHRPGQIGPFSLLTYDDTVGWGPMIAEVIEQGRMPPWHADPNYGHFVNDARLTPDEKQLILGWVQAGCPPGDAADAPEPREFVEGWQIPQPDQVVYISEAPYVVPAEGVVPYEWFEVDPGFTEDKWISAVECRPGNPAVVHHVTVYFRPPWIDWELKLGDRINMLGGYSPGKRPVTSDNKEQAALFIPKGSKLVFEMHYTVNGTVQADRSCVALKFADPALVKHQMSVVPVANTTFEIPPGADSHRVDASYTFDEDSLVFSLSPHMHLRGKAFRFEAEYPDHTREILLDVPAFDFNWQTDYILVEPKRMPKGTRMHCTAHFDNSGDNPANPDPTLTVRWGDQIWEEMMIGGLGIVPEHQDLSRGIGKPRLVVGTHRHLRNQFVIAGVLMTLAATGGTWMFRRNHRK